MKNKKIINKINEGFEVGGAAVNGIFVFINTALKNIGKLLSTGVVLFTIYLIWIAFSGQIENIPERPGIEESKANPELLAKSLTERRDAYANAITSVAAPLATLAGIVPTIIGIGMMVNKLRRKEDEDSIEPEESVEGEETIPDDSENRTGVSY